MNALRSLELFSHASDLVGPGTSPQALYRAVDAAMDELVGYKLLTILRLEGHWLRRMHSSDLQRYPAGGAKDIANDAWLQTLLGQGRPVISATAEVVRERFFDHETIFSLGCAAVLNVPITGRYGTLGSLNLLHEEGRFKPEHVLLARPFALLLALAWSGAPPSAVAGNA